LFNTVAWPFLRLEEYREFLGREPKRLPSSRGGGQWRSLAMCGAFFEDEHEDEYDYE
jgi:hypothetical protein